MNYLAHAYLSFNMPSVLAGNMISDFVKGKNKFSYPQEIQTGIALHRFIDKYTDDHPATKKAKEIFRPVYRLYSGAFVDVVYDHFLATDEAEFTEESLQAFTEKTFKLLDLYTGYFPEPFSSMYPYMKTQNWLYNYQFKWGVEKSLQGVVRRATYLTESQQAYHLFENNYHVFKSCYNEFFPDLKKQTLQKLTRLLNNKDDN